MKKTIIAATAGTAMAAALGLGLAQVAQADTETPTPSPSASASASVETDYEHPGRGHHRGGVGYDSEALAEKLGLDSATVADAVEAARDAVRPSERPAAADREQHHADFVAALAEELGVDEAEVSAAVEELRAERQAERAAGIQDVLDEAVADGTLTQAEADAVAKAADAGIVGMRGHR